jgi:hypothetical protein
LIADATTDTDRPIPTSLIGCGVQQPADRRVSDRQRGQQDQRALDTGRQVVGLLVSIGVILVRQSSRPMHDDQGEQRGDQVYHRLGGV